MMNKTRNFDLCKISLLNQNFDRYCRLYTVFKYVIRNIRYQGSGGVVFILRAKRCGPECQLSRRHVTLAIK